MLASLRIRNFILMDDCTLEWNPGFSVLTGETGAGKSVIISALSLLLGERGSSDQVRDETRDAFLEAVFHLPREASHSSDIRTLLEEAGLPGEDDLLILSRRITPGGRSRHFVNNSTCLLKTMQAIGERLVDLHGQHDHQSLLQRSAYLPLVDQFGGYSSLLASYRSAYDRWRDIEKQILSLQQDEREQQRQIDLLQHQIGMIDEAELAPGEDDRIESRFRVIQHAERLAESGDDVVNTLNESRGSGDSLLDELQRLDGVLAAMAETDDTLRPVADAWQPALIALQECSLEVERYLQSLEFDPDELNTLQERRYRIRELKSRFGSTIEEILQFAEVSREQLQQIRNQDETLTRLDEERRQLETTLADLARKLHKKRETCARSIAKQVNAELHSLGMKDAVFSVAVAYREAEEGLPIEAGMTAVPGPTGVDEIDFLISTIPGKPPRPLREIASGGEISRVMLALKCTFARVDPVPVLVFDEIDVGVGGETADVIAERISTLAQSKQVICITHLPSLASRAAHNIRVEKSTEKGLVISRARTLNNSERETELARMLGDAGSEESRRYARAMLKNASVS